MWKGEERMPKLNAVKVQAIRKPGRYGDGETLFLYVSRGGTKSWVQRVTIDGKRRDIGLGPYPVVSLAKARRRAFENRVAIADGRDPLAEKHKAAVPTFRQAAERTFEAHKVRWRNARHAAGWWQTLERHAMPRLGNMRVNKIDREAVLAVLTPIWGTRQETARRVRQRIRTILGWALAHGFVEHNMADAVAGALPAMPTVQEHHRALPYSEVRDALATVEASQASLAVKLCFEFVVLTAARSGEAREATWDEIDLDAREWRVPGARMKSGTEHRVPLSSAAVEVLKRAQTLDDGSGIVFASPRKRGQALSNMALTKLLRDVKLADRATAHGFRSAFRTWAAEKTSASHAVMELSLAHAVGSSVERSYARSDLFTKRRALMQRWADYVTSSGAQVIKLHG